MCMYTSIVPYLSCEFQCTLYETSYVYTVLHMQHVYTYEHCVCVSVCLSVCLFASSTPYTVHVHVDVSFVYTCMYICILYYTLY